MQQIILKTPQKDKVVIDAADYEDDPVREWVCPWCNFIIHARGEVDCHHCKSTVDLGAGKAQEMQTIEDPNQQDIEPAVVSIQYNLEDQIRIRKPVEPKGSFAELQRRGIRITSYEERDGAGRPISWKREGEEEE